MDAGAKVVVGYDIKSWSKPGCRTLDSVSPKT